MKSTKITKVYYLCTHCQHMVKVDVPDGEPPITHDDEDDEIRDLLKWDNLDVTHCEKCGTDGMMVMIDAGVAGICDILNHKGYYTFEGHEAAVVHPVYGLYNVDPEYMDKIRFPQILFSHVTNMNALMRVPKGWECSLAFEVDGREYYTIEYVPGKNEGKTVESREKLITEILPNAMNDLLKWVMDLPDNQYLINSNGDKLLDVMLSHKTDHGESICVICELNSRLYAFEITNRWMWCNDLKSRLMRAYRFGYDEDLDIIMTPDFALFHDVDVINRLCSLLSEWFRKMANDLDKQIEENQINNK